MFCSNCGKEIPDNQNFCNYCGAKVVKNNNSVDANINLSDAELTNKIKQAQGELVRQGVTDLSDTVPDLELAASYATFLWNNRNATGETDLPKFLKFMRNNRIFSAKMRS